ncbi:MAG: MFS transporter [Candidatus Fermentibacter sp.]|nr:MFS transporter [Candidatus Fermentibacter sp.]
MRSLARRNPLAERIGLSGNLGRMMIGVALMAAAGNVFSSVMPDFLFNVLRVGGETRGALEVPRELPGFLQVVLVGLVAGMARGRALSICFLAGVVSFLVLAVAGSSFAVFMACMLLWSAGMHLYVPLRDALAMDLGPGRGRGWILGTVGAYRSAGLMLGTGIVWVVLGRIHGGFGAVYGAAAVVLALGFALTMAIPRVRGDRTEGEPGPSMKERFVLRREYRLYYILAILFGARKQIFLTFAPWLLVSLFDQKAPDLALAMGAAALLGLFSKPLFGDLIDRYGEKSVLTVESILVFAMCIGYAAAPSVLARGAALAVLYSLYVLDELLFSLSMARTTYLSRIARCSGDIVPTLGLGGTLDHAVSMLVPAGAGLLWAFLGPWSVFCLAAVVAAVNLVFVRKMESR